MKPNPASELVSIDLETIEESTANYFGGDLIGIWNGQWTGEAIIKARGASICEVWSYRLARALGVRVPTYQPFVVESEYAKPGFTARRGTIGIAVKTESDWRNISRRSAAKLDPELVSRTLALFLFDRHEWGEFALLRDQVLVFDLEYNFPGIRPADYYLESPEDFSRIGLREVEDFVERADSAWQEVSIEANELGIWKETLGQIERIAEFHEEDLIPIFESKGHPAGDELLGMGLAAFEGRRERIRERMA